MFAKLISPGTTGIGFPPRKTCTNGDLPIAACYNNGYGPEQEICVEYGFLLW